MRPCPFRADTDDLLVMGEEREVWVQCLGCEARGPRAVDPEVAIKMWNQRVVPR